MERYKKDSALPKVEEQELLNLITMLTRRVDVLTKHVNQRITKVDRDLQGYKTKIYNDARRGI